MGWSAEMAEEEAAIRAAVPDVIFRRWDYDMSLAVTRPGAAGGIVVRQAPRPGQEEIVTPVADVIAFLKPQSGG
ncbi:hypothetical protein [Methylobacterium sp. Gmos1]